jgi:hypothetical protein
MTAVLSNVRFETPVVSFKLRDASTGALTLKGKFPAEQSTVRSMKRGNLLEFKYGAFQVMGIIPQ